MFMTMKKSLMNVGLVINETLPSNAGHLLMENKF